VEREAGEQGAFEGFVGCEVAYKLEGHTYAPVDLDLMLFPVNDPVFAHRSAGVQTELDLSVSASVGGSGGEDLDDKLRCCMKLAVAFQNEL
jgi:hypothetical protein